MDHGAHLVPEEQQVRPIKVSHRAIFAVFLHRLAPTEEIFASPMYNALLVDQSVALNRRRDGENDLDYEAIRDELQEDRMDQFYHQYKKFVDDNEAQV